MERTQHGNECKEGLCLQEIGVKLGTDAEGQLRFTVTDTVEEAREAARALQVQLMSHLVSGNNYHLDKEHTCHFRNGRYARH